MSPLSISGKCFVLITGASSGFGQAIAQLLVMKSGILENATIGSKILLLSRNSVKIEQTKSLKMENGMSMNRFEINFVTLDMSNSNETQNSVLDFIGKLGLDFNHVLIFNSAGSLGDISKSPLEYDWDVSDYQSYFNINIISPIHIITKLCQHFMNTNCTVLQGSSIAAIQPMAFTHLFVLLSLQWICS